MKTITRMLRPLLALAAAAIVALPPLALAAEPPAPAPGFSRKVVLDQDLSVAGRHGVVALIEFAVGGAASRHSHPGEELGYVIEGTVQLEVDGKAPQIFKTGETFFIPAGTIHTARNAGTTPAKVVSSYFAEKGQPLATPAPAAK